MLTSYQNREWAMVSDPRRRIQCGKWQLIGDLNAFVEVRDVETFKQGKGVTGPLCPVFGWCNDKEMSRRILQLLNEETVREGNDDYGWHPVYTHFACLEAVVSSEAMANHPLIEVPIPAPEVIMPSVPVINCNPIFDCIEL